MSKRNLRIELDYGIRRSVRKGHFYSQIPDDTAPQLRRKIGHFQTLSFLKSPSGIQIQVAGFVWPFLVAEWPSLKILSWVFIRVKDAPSSPKESPVSPFSLSFVAAIFSLYENILSTSRRKVIFTFTWEHIWRVPFQTDSEGPSSNLFFSPDQILPRRTRTGTDIILPFSSTKFKVI